MSNDSRYVGDRAEYIRDWNKRKLREDPARRLLYSARARASRFNLDCTISLDDIVIPTHCPYLGIELTAFSERGTPRTASMSLDRIDPSKGYTPDNIEVISWLANTMKSKATKEQLIMFSKTVLGRFSE